jgi:hypothetical protein
MDSVAKVSVDAECFVQVMGLPTNAVSVAVDKVFVGAQRPGKSTPVAGCMKTIRLTHGFYGDFCVDKASALLRLAPKSVGASVDKMFAIGYRPYG